ncbi:hypothetical protein CONCODRAFT_10646 [Conidiobolus coronatus NRRL 28638]|uniref:Ricin B lectin domain-containing protein n=1 Tax=Conidiobolus coronatus (strain ATCC 28846 / CBS 209.66 / NRRL 28638) TaxID=796925 RepID=A0A137NWV1_CONC2|nr:hypothetical protein CONCODRAFT_10646 [Conidiobolus coronatus NRRL 28638]|eukprot:KXN67303.1 hypothetical protein CONCODRAFT_10646 [Conidiobolus coronatus NRRL 28638]
MLLFQVKALVSLYIFANIVACQFSSGYYKIQNFGIRPDFLAVGPQVPAGTSVIGRPPIPGPDLLAEWIISSSGGSQNTIRNLQTGQYLSFQGNKAILTNQPTPWIILNKGDGSFSISSSGEVKYLGLNPSTSPPDAILSSSPVGANSQWILQNISQ